MAITSPAQWRGGGPALPLATVLSRGLRGCETNEWVGAGREEMDEAREEQRRATENGEQLAGKESARWCVAVKEQLCAGVTSGVLGPVMTDGAEVETGACVAYSWLECYGIWRKIGRVLFSKVSKKRFKVQCM